MTHEEMYEIYVIHEMVHRLESCEELPEHVRAKVEEVEKIAERMID